VNPSGWYRFLLACLLISSLRCLYAVEGPGSFNNLEEVHLGGSRNSDQNLTLSVGSGLLQFRGTWAPILQGQKTIGLYLNGLGTFSYVSTFTSEQPVFTHNLKEWTSLSPTKNAGLLSVSIPFKEARILLAGCPRPRWDGSPSAPSEATYQVFERRWKKVEEYVPFHLLAIQAANAPLKTVAFVELEDGDKRFAYKYDGVDKWEETLSFLRGYPNPRPELKDVSFLLPLSRQFIGWDPRKGQQGPAHFLLTALDVDLRTRDNRQADMVVQETILPLEDGLQVFPFSFWTSLVTDKDTRHLRMKGIFDGAGNPLEFNHIQNRLVVRLPAAARRGVPFTLRLEYSGDFLIRPEEDNYWELPVREGWYPTPERYGSEWYTFHGTIRTTGDWIAFLPGETVRQEKDGDWNLVETCTTQPICFATILAGKYYLDEVSQDGLKVRIATYGFKPGPANEIFKTQAFNVIRYYERFLGPFPFKEFVIIEKNDWGYGQAPPGMMYITRDAFEQMMTAKQLQAYADVAEALKRRGNYHYVRPNLKTMDVRHVFAHEIAHQYWGTVVKMPSPMEQWVTESFAEYCAGLFERDYKGNSLWERNLSHWKEGAESVTKKAPIPLANDLRFSNPSEAFYARRNLLYDKGPILLASLHQELGDKVFLTWLKSIQTNFRWKFVSTKQLFDLLGFITKKNYKDFYDDYYWDLGLPPLKK